LRFSRSSVLALESAARDRPHASFHFTIKAMAKTKQHRILVASDGSPSAEAAITTVIRFPWNPSARARGVVANFPWLKTESAAAQAVVESSVQAAAVATEQALRRRWPAARVAVSNAPPIEAILADAAKFRATVIALGWRGHGAFKRLIAGSVSRAIASNAQCTVLVAREAPKALRRIVVGHDGSPNATQAIELLASLAAPRGARVILVDAVVRQVLPATAGRLPTATRKQLQQELRALNEERRQHAQKLLESGAARLRRVGWKVDIEVRDEDAVAAILAAADDHQADIVAVGARAISGLERLLLGSVANGVLNRSKVPVLLVR
jgi:nucleotide-binding universal stress UspA family protein